MDSIAFSPPRGPGDGPKLQPVLRQRPPLRSCQLLYNPTARMLGQLESLGGLEMKWTTWNQASSRFWIINDNQWYSNQNKCSLESRLSLGVKIKTVDTIHFILLLEAAAALGRAAQKRSWISTTTTSTSRDPTATVYYTIGVQHSGPRLPSTGRNAKFRHQGAKQRPQRVWHGKWRLPK